MLTDAVYAAAAAIDAFTPHADTPPPLLR